ncbi:hypothetical protein N8E89_24105 (plasmid) [Phyllobacterium sp. A18/5-2]|uniref:hypothetical protein n=1 Tax=Phyllobacterium sp. A18/5-2 TaxID=2978392 RepID=UPI0021C7EF61|nr:hypothetical protein [Phyllobacterium sp. A18/5-2]UXN66264.1 hypothetical protein N8E89_24105 [Phyllobacterium sp. A18/5-2]
MANKRNYRGDDTHSGNSFGAILPRRDQFTERIALFFLDAVDGRFGRLLSFTMIILIAVSIILLVTILGIVGAIVPGVRAASTSDATVRSGAVLQAIQKGGLSFFTFALSGDLTACIEATTLG